MTPTALIGRGLDRLTAAPRRRAAEAVFWGARPSRLDRALSRCFFALSAREWMRRGTTEQHLAPFLEGLTRCRAPHNALDLGTGPGATAARVAQRYPAARVFGIDVSGQMIRVAAQTYQAPNLEYRRASVERLPFESKQFDLVCMHNALPEIRELDRVASEDAQLLVANTYFAPDGPWANAWMDRWRSAGFSRVDANAVGDGGWQLFQRSGPASH